MKKKIKLIFIISFSFWLGYEASNNDLFPINKFIIDTFLTKKTKVQKKINIYSDISIKQKIQCPNPDNAIIVIGFGQSNSANHTGHRFEGNEKILNFFNGECYIASDPMLGATGKSGSIWLPLLKHLDSQKKKIVLITLGVSGSTVDQWLHDDTLNLFYQERVYSLKKKYPKPDLAIWFQGESDISTPVDVFEKNLNKWLRTLIKDFPSTTLYLTGTSYCSGKQNSKITSIQKNLAEKLSIEFLGITDNLKHSKYRYDDCHFSEKGVIEVTNLMAKHFKHKKIDK